MKWFFQTFTKSLSDFNFLLSIKNNCLLLCMLWIVFNETMNKIDIHSDIGVFSFQNKFNHPFSSTSVFFNPIQVAFGSVCLRVVRSQKSPSQKSVTHTYNNETWFSYTLTNEDTKVYKSREAKLEFYNSTISTAEVRNFWFN